MPKKSIVRIYKQLISKQHRREQPDWQLIEVLRARLRKLQGKKNTLLSCPICTVGKLDKKLYLVNNGHYREVVMCSVCEKRFILKNDNAEEYRG